MNKDNKDKIIKLSYELLDLINESIKIIKYPDESDNNMIYQVLDEAKFKKAIELTRKLRSLT